MLARSSGRTRLDSTRFDSHDDFMNLYEKKKKKNGAKVEIEMEATNGIRFDRFLQTYHNLDYTFFF